MSTQLPADWRSAMPELWDIAPDLFYFNHGAFGLPPRTVMGTQRDWQRQCMANPMEFYCRKLEPAWYSARQRLSQFLGTSEANLAFCTCATTGMNHIASFYPLQKGDEVLLNNHEYGVVKEIWKRRCRQTQATYREFSIPLPIEDPNEIVEQYASTLQPNTKLVVFSHITSPTAVTFPAQRLCDLLRSCGVHICIDGPHAILQEEFSIDSLHCDFYTASCHKWLAAPLGSGFTYIAPQWHHAVEPFEISWGRLPPAEKCNWTEHQIWVGTRDYSPYLTVPTAIDFFEQMGVDAVRDRNRRLAQYARQLLCERLGQPALVADDHRLYGWMAAVWLPPGDWSQLQKRLWSEQNVEIPVIHFEGRFLIRVSCHLYHSTQQIEQLVDKIAMTLRS